MGVITCSLLYAMDPKYLALTMLIQPLELLTSNGLLFLPGHGVPSLGNPLDCCARVHVLNLCDVGI